MLTYKLIYSDDKIVKYEYHPEDREEYGIIVYDKFNKEFLHEKKAYEDDVHDSFFSKMMFSKILKFAESNNFLEEGMIAWY